MEYSNSVTVRLEEKNKRVYFLCFWYMYANKIMQINIIIE